MISVSLLIVCIISVRLLVCIIIVLLCVLLVLGY